MSFKGTLCFLFCMGMLLTANPLIAEDDNQDYSPSGGGWSKKSDTEYEHKGALFTGFRYSDTTTATNTYKFTVGPPYGWNFIPSETSYSGGTKLLEPTVDYTGIKKINEADKDPVSFSMTMSGQLTRGGGGSGIVSWNAKVDADFYYLSPHDIIHGFYGHVIVSSKKNDELVVSNWSMTGQPPKSDNSIVIGNFQTSDWKPDPGSYVISASLDSTRSANTSLKVVRVTFRKNPTYGFDDETDRDFPSQSMEAGVPSYINVDITPASEITLNGTGVILTPTTISSYGGDVTVTSANPTNWVTIDAKPTKANGSDFAGKMYIRAYSPAVRTIAFVKINGAGLCSENLNAVFKQAVVSFNYDNDNIFEVTTEPEEIPSDGKWTTDIP